MDNKPVTLTEESGFNLSGELEDTGTPKTRITPKRTAILNALRGRKTLTLDEAVELIGKNIYANKKFHVGNLLSAMVKMGLIQRVKPGVFTSL